MPNQVSISTITYKSSWENFTKKHPEANFLSSWQWGQFHASLGKSVEYRGYYQDQTLIGTSLMVVESAKRGRYITIAGGPLLDWHNSALVEAWVRDIKSLASKHRVSFVRVRPQIADTPDHQQLFTSLGFSASPMHLTADLTLQLDLTLSLEELLSQMRKSTRYEIKKADKLNIRVEESTNLSDIQEFYHHQLELAHKHNFIPFSLEFLEKQFSAFMVDNHVRMFHSYLDNKLLASAFIIMYGQEAVYHYGISTPDNQRLPGSYATQWAAIKTAKDLGLKRYNFWGIAPESAGEDHRFAGVSLFKRGFGGREVAYLPAQDLPTSWLYWPTKWFEAMRAKRRHLN